MSGCHFCVSPPDTDSALAPQRGRTIADPVQPLTGSVSITSAARSPAAPLAAAAAPYPRSPALVATRSLKLLQAGRHRLVRLLTALLASALDALVRADARPLALLASAPDALARADARAPALLACAPDALVRTLHQLLTR